jgi:hypothetical protein
MHETMVIEYRNKSDLENGIRKLQNAGWTVINIQNVQQGYSCFKTCLFGLIFLPLALLGRKPEKYLVTYQREKRYGNK